jgi:IS5 family transposase
LGVFGGGLSRKEAVERGGVPMKKLNKREVNWSIQRMKKIVKTWNKLDDIDKRYLIDRFMDEMVLAKIRRQAGSPND